MISLYIGVAQVDAFELLFTSEDDAEAGYGEEISPSDFRYIGYRVVEPEGQAGTCDYLLEFSFTTWVRTICRCITKCIHTEVKSLTLTPSPVPYR